MSREKKTRNFFCLITIMKHLFITYASMVRGYKKKKEKKKLDKVLSSSHVQTGFSLKTNPKGFFQYEATM